jgi:hypothetical protein
MRGVQTVNQEIRAVRHFSTCAQESGMRLPIRGACIRGRRFCLCCYCPRENASAYAVLSEDAGAWPQIGVMGFSQLRRDGPVFS